MLCGGADVDADGDHQRPSYVFYSSGGAIKAAWEGLCTLCEPLKGEFCLNANLNWESEFAVRVGRGQLKFVSLRLLSSRSTAACSSPFQLGVRGGEVVWQEDALPQNFATATPTPCRERSQKEDLKTNPKVF